MIHSMTGYAAAQGVGLAIELRSVNARFLDLQFRVSEELRSVEPLLRELIGARVARGKIDCRLYFTDDAAAARPVALNAEAVRRLRQLADEAANLLPQAAPLRIADVLRWPGVVSQPTVSEDETRAAAGELCRKALDELVAFRAREGAKLAAAVGERVAAMRQRLDELAPRLPEALAAYEARLAEKLREALGAADAERLRTEVALFSAKADVDEEITRLRTHLAEVERTLASGGSRASAAGKRLDFLAQELNREANTLASKAASQEISECALELKLLVEQVREQVQNIE